MPEREDSQEVGQLSFTTLIVLCSLFVAITIGTILVIQGQRYGTGYHAPRGGLVDTAVPPAVREVEHGRAAAHGPQVPL